MPCEAVAHITKLVLGCKHERTLEQDAGDAVHMCGVAREWDRV